MSLVEDIIYWRKESRFDHYNKTPREIYYKKCFELCSKCKFNTKEIEVFSKQIGITAYSIRTKANTYAKDVLKMSKQEIKEMLSIYRLGFDSLEDCYKKCYEIYKMHNWELKKVEGDIGLSIRKIKEYAKKYAIECQGLTEKEWLKLIKPDIKLSNEEIESYKIYYDMCEENNWSTTIIEQKNTNKEISAKTIKERAQIYALEILKLSKDELFQRIMIATHQVINPNKTYVYQNDHYVALLNELINIKKDNKEEIISKIKIYMNEKNISPISLKIRIPDFVINYYPEKKNTLIKELEEKVNVYFDELFQKDDNKNTHRKNIKELKTPEIIRYIKGFIDSDLTDIEAFCKKEFIDVEYFNGLVKSCKKYQIEIFNELKEKIEKSCINNYQEILDTTRKICQLIKDGIPTLDGGTRKFDIIDYCMMMKLSFKELIFLVEKDLTLEEFKAIRTFFGDSKKLEEENLYEMEDILSGKCRIGYLVQGQQYYPNIDEIKFIDSFLKEHNIPRNRYNYSIAVRRYLKTNLPIDYQDSRLGEDSYIRRLQK